MARQTVHELSPEAIDRLEKQGVFVGDHRWPVRGVYSEEFVALPEHERMYELALGNVQSAKSLCIELGEHSERLSWPRGAVVYYLTHLAAELFLKACLLRRGRRLATHEISELQDAFDEAFPKQRGIQTQWDMNLVELATFGPGPADRRMPARDDEAYRYFSDRQGNPPDGDFSFTPALYITVIERFEKDFVEVWRSLTTATPASPR